MCMKWQNKILWLNSQTCSLTTSQLLVCVWTVLSVCDWTLKLWFGYDQSSNVLWLRGLKSTSSLCWRLILDQSSQHCVKTSQSFCHYWMSVIQPGGFIWAVVRNKIYNPEVEFRYSVHSACCSFSPMPLNSACWSSALGSSGDSFHSGAVE